MNGINAYKQNAVTTQTPGHLVVMLYEGAIRNMRGMIEAIEQDNPQLLAERGHKAGAILNELDASLDTDAGREISLQLRRLYGFCRVRSMQGQIRKDTQAINEVVGVLEDLLQGWRAVAS